MDTVLVDTNVFSYIHRKDTRAELYRSHLDGKRLALSFLTVAELYRWAVERKWAQKKIDELRAKLKSYTSSCLPTMRRPGSMPRSVQSPATPSTRATPGLRRAPCAMESLW
jgi:tRNA(fMet)-specific endonuclease VapC